MLSCPPNLARVLDAQGRPEESIEAFRRALRIKEQAVGPDDPSLPVTLGNLGEVLGRTGRFDEAIAALERAVAIQTRPGGAPDPAVGFTQFALARALWDSGRDRARARALAQAALAAFAAMGPRAAGRRAEVEAWLAAHR